MANNSIDPRHPIWRAVGVDSEQITILSRCQVLILSNLGIILGISSNPDTAIGMQHQRLTGLIEASADAMGPFPVTSIIEGRDAIHVLNAPSPGATSSLAIGEHIAGLAVANFGEAT